MRILATLLLTLLSATALHAQLQIARITGVLKDAAGQPVRAVVTLADPLGVVVSTTQSDPAGAFRLDDVAPGAYDVHVAVGGTRVATRPLVVRGALPMELAIALAPAVREEVVVRGDGGSNTVENPTTIAGDAVRRSAEALPGQRVQAALAGVRGWSAEDNGLLHVRGVDDGLLYVQDGVPVYERVDRLFGQPPPAAAISSLHVMDGYVPPEFGYKAGAVVVVRSASGLDAGWNGSIDGGVGGESTRHLQGTAAGPAGGAVGLLFSASDERSSRFLDPIDPGNLHNQGRATTAGAQVTWARDARRFTGVVQGGRSAFDVPNGEEQEEAGQDQRQRTSQLLLSGSWQQARAAQTIWQSSIYFRHGRSSLLPSAFDTPITADADRSSDRYGALVSATHQRGRHTLKAGAEASGMLLDERFSFAITDEEEAEEADISDAALEFDAGNPFRFADRRRPWLFSLFAQDAIAVSDRLTLNVGARFDRSRMLEDAWQLSPRAGVAFAATPATTVRASFMRLYQPPQAEFLLLSSSEEARVLSPFEDDDEIGGGSVIPPERQTAVDASVTHVLGRGLTIGATGWVRRGKDVDDPNVFVGTTIIFPNSVARQRAGGFDAGLTFSESRGFSASLAYTYARVVQFGPMTGGLFLEDEVADVQDGTRFIPDHDQRHGVAATGSVVEPRTGIRVTGSFRYQTGTPVGIEDEVDEELLERPGAETIDVESGRVKPRAVVDLQALWTAYRGGRGDVAVRVWVNNLANQTYAFNFGNPFSGTHFGAGRRAGVSVQITLR